MKVQLHTAEKTIYCEYWQKNAAAFADQGCYSWMASQLSPYAPRRVLDVGCGTGEGLLALLEGTCKNIVALEENFDCIKATERRLLADGREVTVLPRIGYCESPDGKHDLIIDQNAKLDEGTSTTLIHADPLLWEVDFPLKNYIASARKFDAITVWLLGTYEMRKTCRTLENLSIQSASDYRLRVQNTVYIMADALLKRGGVLHIVDRGLVTTPDKMREIMFQAHREQAAPTSLKPDTFNFRFYDEPTTKRIGMVRPENDGTVTDDGRRAMHSIISIKI